jgi:hypothetical protein
MTHDRDLERLLDRWLADGPSIAADRVIDDVASRIVRQRQRPAWRLRPWRFPTMSTPIKLVAAGAALLIAILGGAALMGGGGRPAAPIPTATPSPSPSPSPSIVAAASPSAAASAGAAFPAWWPATGDRQGAGILTAGSHTAKSFLPPFTFRVPEGWINDHDSADIFAMLPDTPTNQAALARSGSAAQAIEMGPLRSPWFVCKSIENNTGDTAAQMVAAARANDALAITGLADVAIGGLTGKQFDVRLNPDWTGTCPPSPDDPPDLNLAESRSRVVLLDAASRGVIVIFVGSVTAADFEPFLAEAMPIVESFAFDVGPTASPS